MMECTGISHIAVCVRDMDKSLAFYRDILGMTISKDAIEDTSTGAMPNTYKHQRNTRRTVHIGYGGETFLVMTTHPGDKAEGEPIKLDQIGVSHVSFTVKNLRAVADEMISKGVEIAGGFDAFADAQGKVRTFFAFDPDGIMVQFDSGIES